jgi:hypothetical protein
MVSFHHKYLDNLYGKVVFYICSGETVQNGAFVGEINYVVANLYPLLCSTAQKMDPLKEDID